MVLPKPHLLLNHILHCEMSKESSLVNEFSIQVEIKSLEQTAQIGYALGQLLFSGCAVALCGDLGAGKTTLSKSICHGLGVSPNDVISPTYTFVNAYFGKLPILHVDLYRLESQDDLSAYDLEDFICFDGITLVEWPDFLLDELEELPLLQIQILTHSETERTLHFSTKDSQLKTLLQQSPLLQKS